MRNSWPLSNLWASELDIFRSNVCGKISFAPLNILSSVYFTVYINKLVSAAAPTFFFFSFSTVKILKFGTLQTIAIIVLKIEKFDVTLH